MVANLREFRTITPPLYGSTLDTMKPDKTQNIPTRQIGFLPCRKETLRYLLAGAAKSSNLLGFEGPADGDKGWQTLEELFPFGSLRSKCGHLSDFQSVVYCCRATRLTMQSRDCLPHERMIQYSLPSRTWEQRTTV